MPKREMIRYHAIGGSVDIEDEFARAIMIHPDWPDDVIHQVAIMIEEAGETMQAALNYKYHGGEKEKIKEELIQTAAMCLRCLVNL